MEWLRWYHGATSDTKWPIIARRSRQPVGVVVSIWAALLEHASQHEDRGSVEGFDCESLDALFGYEDGVTQAVVSAMEAKGILEDGRVAAWSKRQPIREDETATERKRSQRERERAARERDKAKGEDESRAGHAGVTHGHASPRARDQSREEQSREELRNTPPPPSCAVQPQAEAEEARAGEEALEPEVEQPAAVLHQFTAEFEVFFEAYPRKDNKAAAFAAWRKLGARKPAPFDYLPAIQAWKASRQWQTEGGRYIPQAARWLQESRWLDPPPEDTGIVDEREMMAQAALKVIREQKEAKQNGRHQDDPGGAHQAQHGLPPAQDAERA